MTKFVLVLMLIGFDGQPTIKTGTVVDTLAQCVAEAKIMIPELQEREDVAGIGWGCEKHEKK